MIRPMEHTGDAANIAFYRERAWQRDEPYIWCEVMRCLPWRRTADNEPERDTTKPIYFRVTVRRNREGEIAQFTYTPSTQPPPDPLPARTVAKLIRERLA